MAQRTEVITYRTDDLDGTDLGKTGTTVEFAVNGTAYEIDLSEKNAKAMMDSLGRYIEHARKPSHTGRRRGRSAGTHSTTTLSSQETKAARAWLIEQGILSADSRGRISGENMEKYRSRGQMRMPATAGTGGTTETAKPAPPANSTTPEKRAAKATTPAKATA